MKILILGFSGWISNPWFNYTSILIEVDENYYLIDCGEGIGKELIKLGIDLDKLRCIFITHAHGDHILGLPTLILWSSYLKKKLKIIALKEVNDIIKKITEFTGIGHHLSNIEFIDLNECEDICKCFKDDKIEVYYTSVDHTVPTIAFKVIDKKSGKSIVYSGDTKPCKNIIELSRNVDLLIYEIGGLDEFKEISHLHGHSTPSDLIEIAVQANVKKVMPIHFYTKLPEFKILKIDKELTFVIPIPNTWYEV